MKLVILSLLIVATTAQAGERVGNGGGAFVCWNGDQTVSKSVSYDLWRGAHEHGLSITRDNSLSVQEQYRNAISKMGFYSSLLRDELLVIADATYTKIQASLAEPSERFLARQTDFSPTEVPGFDFCSNGQLPTFETTVLYQDSAALETDGVRVYQRVLKGFETKTDLAALIFHEAFYKWMRKHPPTQWNGYEVAPLSVNANSVLLPTAQVFSSLTPEQLSPILGKIAPVSRYIDQDAAAFSGNLFSAFFIAKNEAEMDRIFAISRTYQGKTLRLETGARMSVSEDYDHVTYPGQTFFLTIGDTLLSNAVRQLDFARVKYLVGKAGVDVNQAVTVTRASYYDEGYSSQDSGMVLTINPLNLAYRPGNYLNHSRLSRPEKDAQKQIIAYLESHGALKAWSKRTYVGLDY